MTAPESNSRRHLLIAAVAAFCTYFCMYAFRKPFTAATYEDQLLYGWGLKTTLIVAQLSGYMLSKFVGIKVVSEMRPEQRSMAIIALIVTAELALVGFALLPDPIKPLMMFLNGLPLGMIFGIVLSYLEGRKHTEALSATLCASFIISSGVVKSIGRWMVQDLQVSEFWMPTLVGLVFFPPLLASVWALQTTPPPDTTDRRLRRARTAMSGADRRRFWNAYWPGLTALVVVYVALTTARTIRDDFGVEIWRDMGIDETPSVFARSETLVAILVTALNAMAIWIRHNVTAIRVILLLMCLSFAMIGGLVLLQAGGTITPFAFMVACGVGLYFPYVAFHTTVFERLIAASHHPGNLVFLMYVADAVGYLGYAIVLLARAIADPPQTVLPLFRLILITVAGVSLVSLWIALHYFRRVFANHSSPPQDSIH